MSRVIDRLELSQNKRRGYRNGISAEQVPLQVPPRYVNIMRTVQIGLGILSGAMICIMLLVQ